MIGRRFWWLILMLAALAACGESAPETSFLAVSDQSITPADKRGEWWIVPAGEEITFKFTVKNRAPEGGPTGTMLEVRAGGRGPGICQGWESPDFAEFPSAHEINLAPQATYAYSGTHVYQQPGIYFAEPVKLGGDGRWGGFSGAQRFKIKVVGPDGQVPSDPTC